MKRKLILSIIACGASLALCPGLHAQDAAASPSATGTDAGQHQWGNHRGGGPAMMLQRLTTALDLTADQQAKNKPILEAETTQMQANRQDASLTQPDKMAKNKAIREDANTQINAILTPDQQTKFAAMQEKMRARRQAAEAQASASPAASATP